MNKLIVTFVAGAWLVALPIQAQDILPAEREYATGTFTYRLQINGDIPGMGQSGSDYQTTVEIADSRRGQMTATFTIDQAEFSTNGRPSTGGVDPRGYVAVARMTPTGEVRSIMLQNPRTEYSAGFAEPFRTFLPPQPPSLTIGTTWTVPFSHESVTEIPGGIAGDVITHRTNTNTTFTVASDTTVAGRPAVKVSFDMSGTQETANRGSPVVASSTSISQLRGSGVHLFSRDGVFLGSDYSTHLHLEGTTIRNSYRVDLID